MINKLPECLDKEILIKFIEDYAAHDAKFANAVNVRFGKPEFAYELSKIETAIDDALDGISDYSTHDSWGDAIFDVSDIIDEIMQRVKQGHIRLAFAEIEKLYRKLLANLEYQGECEISAEADNCIEIMSEIADKALADDDKLYIYKHCIELTKLEDGKNYGVDHDAKLIKITRSFPASLWQ